MPPASTIGAVEECAHRADERERIEPAGLPAGARGEQHQPVGAGRYRALGVADAGDIGKHQRAGIMQRLQHRRGRSDRGDDDLRLVPQQHREILLQPRVGAMHDQVRTERRGGLPV